MASQPSPDLTLRIICLDPPDLSYEPRAGFGLQGKSQWLTNGNKRPDGSLAFTVPITVRGTPGIAAPDFAGPYIHGTLQQRFLYLSLGLREGIAWRWIRRIKVPLSGITWAQVEGAGSKGSLLEASVDGTRSGTVPLLGKGWVVKREPSYLDEAQRQQIIVEGKSYWDQGLPLEAGMTIFERVSLDDRPLWAADILEFVYRDRTAPPEITAALAFARHPEQWPQSREADRFPALRDLRLTLDENSLEDSLIEIGEHMAGIAFTVRHYGAPYDHNRGWRIVKTLYDIVKRLSLDESEAWQIVANERYITLDAPIICHPGCPVCLARQWSIKEE